MDNQAQFTARIDAIQRKLRECNYECNRVKEEVEAFIANTREEASIKARKELEDWKSKFQQTSLATPPVVEAPKEKQPEVTEPLPKEPVVSRDESISKTEAIEIDLSDEIVEKQGTIEAPKEKQPFSQQQPAQNPTQNRPAARPPKAPRKQASQSEIERFVGENLLNKIGIAILVIGIGIFVKYAIDKDWIGPIGRVLIGLLSGGLLLTFAHFLQKKYKAFSSVLVGGGMATLYFTTYISQHTYGLFSQSAAFAIMGVLTIFTVIFSILYNRQEIAVLGLIGGFVAPFLVSTGEGNFKVLFTYMLILNVGMLILAAFRNWKVVNVLSFTFTMLIFGGWFTAEYVFEQDPPVGWALLFATLFFLVFFVMNVVYKVRTKEAFGFLDYTLLFANTGLYYAVGMFALWEISDGLYQGLFTAIMAVFHFAFIFVLKNLFQADRNVILMLAGMVITFLTLAIPVQLEGNFITMFWAAEAVALLWLSRKTKFDMMHIGSLVVAGLSIVSLLMDWEQSYFRFDAGSRMAFANSVFLTSMFVTAAVIAIHFLEKTREGASDLSKTLGTIFFYLSIPIIYSGILLEFLYLGGKIFESQGMAFAMAGAYSALFIAGMTLYSSKTGRKELAEAMMAATAILFLLVVTVIQDSIQSLIGTASFHIHIVLYVSMFVMMGTVLYRVWKDYGLQSAFGKFFTWAFALTVTALASFTLINLLWSGGMPFITTIKVGLPILWGAIAFVLIWQGLKHKLLQFRIVALVIFLVTLIKLFAYDIQTVSTGGKIAAFISLGVLLLVISFMYNRIKQLLIEGEADEEDSSTENDAGA